MGKSDYVTRKGQRLDKQLIKKTEAWRDEKVVVFNMSHADELWQIALDGDKLTDRERETLRYIMKEYKFEDDAAAMLMNHVDPPSSGEGFHVVIKGQKLLRAVWDETVKQTQDGSLDIDEAKILFEMCEKNDDKLTDCAALTLWAVLDEFKSSPNCRRWLEERLPSRAVEEPMPTTIKLGATMSAPPPSTGSSKLESDEFIKLTKEWLYESLNDDDFFTRVQPFLPPIAV